MTPHAQPENEAPNVEMEQRDRLRLYFWARAASAVVVLACCVVAFVGSRSFPAPALSPASPENLPRYQSLAAPDSVLAAIALSGIAALSLFSLHELLTLRSMGVHRTGRLAVSLALIVGLSLSALYLGAI